MFLSDIKSLRKAARQAIAPELTRRAKKIISGETLKIDDDQKICWDDNTIAYIKPGKNYLNPKLDLLVDEAID